MDSLALALLVFVFFAAFVLYYATETLKLKEKKEEDRPLLRPPLPPQTMPEILKHNIAVARLMQLKLQGFNL